MAKEDFKEGTQPIDMDGYPYYAGQKLDNGITVQAVIKGDETDSYGGMLMKPIVERRGSKIIYGKPYVITDAPFTDRHGINPVRDPDNLPADAVDTVMVGPVGDPWAQRVIYKLPNEKNARNATPEEFLEIAAMKDFKGLPKADDVKNFKVKSGDMGTAEDPGDDGGWTQDDDEFIKDNYVRMSDKAMADALDVDVDSLKHHRLEDLKLKKPPFGKK